MTIKELLQKQEELKLQMKKLNEKKRAIEVEQTAVETEIGKFVSDKIGDEINFYEDDCCIINRSHQADTRIDGLAVIANDEARKRLIKALEKGTTTITVGKTFDKDLLGIDNYDSYLTVSVKEKIKVTAKEGK